jgi:hypothetical protein
MFSKEQIMNKDKRSEVGIGAARQATTKRNRGSVKDRAGRVAPIPGGGEPLSREAERLLAALVEPKAEARIDSTEADAVLVATPRRGVSVGGGRFSTSAAEALERYDLAVWEAGRLRATGAGRARHRRRAGETPFLDQHRATGTAIVETDTGPARLRINLEESPLDWLRRRKDRDGTALIDEASYQAGERLRSDITLAGLLPGVTSRWGAPTGSIGSSAPGEATERMIAARQRIRLAMEAVGADFGDLLIDLCGFLKGLALIERERGWPARSGKVAVRLALARLAQHYGIQTVARGPASSRGIRSWQAVVIEGGRS